MTRTHSGCLVDWYTCLGTQTQAFKKQFSSFTFSETGTNFEKFSTWHQPRWHLYRTVVTVCPKKPLDMSLYDLQKRPTSITAKDKYQFYNSLAKKTEKFTCHAIFQEILDISYI